MAGLRIPTVEEFVMNLALNLFFRTSESPYVHIRSVARGPPCQNTKRPRALRDDPTGLLSNILNNALSRRFKSEKTSYH